MRRIKRTTITVIRTETVYLQMHYTDTGAEFLPLQKIYLEEINQNPVIEIEAIREAENTKEGETKRQTPCRFL